MKNRSDISRRVHVYLDAIQGRYEAICRTAGFEPEDRYNTEMDLCYVLMHHPEADLAALAYAPSDVFGHDIFGIKKHIIRACPVGQEKTLGTLGDCFLPRFVSRSMAKRRGVK